MAGYKNWNEKLDMFADTEFVKLKDFIKSVYRIHQHKLSLVTRTEVEKLVSFKFREICGPKKRFPEYSTYVNLSFGFYADAFSDLSTLEPDDPRFNWQLGCVLRHAFAHDDEDSCDAFNRAKFERKYNLRWSEGIRWKWIILSSSVVLLAIILANT